MDIQGNQNSEQKNKQSAYTMAMALLMVILVILIQLFLGKWLWNEVLVGLLPSTVRPIDSLWQVLGLIVLFAIIFSGLTHVSYGCYSGCVQSMS